MPPPSSEPPRWPAPAKLNLFLHVTGRRADGYHALQTVFQLLELADTLSFAVRRDGRVRRLAGLEEVPPERDLVVRAARLLQETSGTRLGADISVDKRIPAGGGLGGGSSDAATTLVALNRLWALGLGEDALAALGLRLGADVPVFVRGRSAWAEGVGERLVPVELEETWYLVVDPGCPVSTAEVFAAPSLTRSTTPTTINGLYGVDGGRHRLRARTLVEWGRNDCEAWVRARHPPIDAALRWLGHYGPARMTGTGGCVFVPLARERDARALLAELPQGWRGVLTRGVGRSPLVAAASS